jgi:hypothetical protein
MCTSWYVELPRAIAVRARCLASSWSEKAELRRVIDEHAIQLQDLCTASGAKRSSYTNTERTHRGSLEHTRKPDVRAAGVLCAGNTCAGNMCAAQKYEDLDFNWLFQFVGLCSELRAPQTARTARDARHRLRSHSPRAHAASGTSDWSLVAFVACILDVVCARHEASQ